MQVEVRYSYTVDFVEWDCPKCGHHNEYFSNDSEYDQRCQGCDFEIENYSSRLGECNGDVDVYEIENWKSFLKKLDFEKHFWYNGCVNERKWKNEKLCYCKFWFGDSNFS